jgi:hypothetical protein
MIKTDLVVRGAPWVGLLLRHRSGGGGLNLGWRHRLSALAALALVAALPLAAIAGVVAASTAAAAVIMLLSLNMSFYRLLARRRGVLHAAAGVALHVVHHLVAVAAVPLGIATYVLARRKAPVAAPEIPAESPAV